MAASLVSLLNRSPAVALLLVVVVIVGGPTSVHRVMDVFFPPVSEAIPDEITKMSRAVSRLSEEVQALRRELEREHDRQAFERFMRSSADLGNRQ